MAEAEDIWQTKCLFVPLKFIPICQKKKKIKVSGLKQACVWGVGFVGNISESHVTHSHIQTFASSSLACLLSSQALGESRIACATINTCDICCYWKLLAMIKSLLHSFNHCLQWPRDCYPPFLTHNCLDFLQFWLLIGFMSLIRD